MVLVLAPVPMVSVPPPDAVSAAPLVVEMARPPLLKVTVPLFVDMVTPAAVEEPMLFVAPLKVIGAVLFEIRMPAMPADGRKFRLPEKVIGWLPLLTVLALMKRQLAEVLEAPGERLPANVMVVLALPLRTNELLPAPFELSSRSPLKLNVDPLLVLSVSGAAPTYVTLLFALNVNVTFVVVAERKPPVAVPRLKLMTLLSSVKVPLPVAFVLKLNPPPVPSIRTSPTFIVPSAWPLL